MRPFPAAVARQQRRSSIPGGVSSITTIPRPERASSPSASSSSSIPDPEPDDTDFFLVQPNDSQSSLGLPSGKDCDPEYPSADSLSPIQKLPPELLLSVFVRVRSHHDLRTCVLVCKRWGKYAIDILWHRPICDNWDKLRSVITGLQDPGRFYEYRDFVKRLNLSNLASNINDGTLHSLSVCKRVERITLTHCASISDSGLMCLLEGQRSLLALDITGLSGITDKSVNVIASDCSRLQGLNITGCSQVTDAALIRVAQGCRHLKRLKLNDCTNVTDRSVVSIADGCRQLLEIDLQRCMDITDEAVTSLMNDSRQLRELRLMSCERLTDRAFTTYPDHLSWDTLRILDLTGCELVTDEAISRIVSSARRLRNLVLAKCNNVTDRGIYSITRLGKNLHYLHLGHCIAITDRAVIELANCCTRIRYIDLACCSKLTDSSVKQLAMLPKLRRIGLVKCSAITDDSIIALATARFTHELQKAREAGLPISPWVPSCLERVHLSYCVNLNISAIHVLLNQCPRLTHLSLTGIQAFFNHSNLIEFCRPAPREFTVAQRNVFCVFSGQGVTKLRAWLNSRTQENGECSYNEDDEDDEFHNGEGDQERELEDDERTVMPVSHENLGQLQTNPLMASLLAEPRDTRTQSQEPIPLFAPQVGSLSTITQIAEQSLSQTSYGHQLYHLPQPAHRRDSGDATQEAFGHRLPAPSYSSYADVMGRTPANTHQYPNPLDEGVGIATGMMGAVHVTDSESDEPHASH